MNAEMKQAPKKKIQQSVKFDTLDQREMIRNAAKMKRWSTSRFMLEAAEKAAVELMSVDRRQEAQFSQ